MAKLEDLLIDESAIDQEALATALAGVVGIGVDGAPHPLAGWTDLTERGKVIATLLALRAAVLLKKREAAGVTPSQVVTMAGVAAGTAKRVLREVVDLRIAVQDPSGNYAVSNPALSSAIAQMKQGGARRGR